MPSFIDFNKVRIKPQPVNKEYEFFLQYLTEMKIGFLNDIVISPFNTKLENYLN